MQSGEVINKPTNQKDQQPVVIVDDRESTLQRLEHTRKELVALFLKGKMKDCDLFSILINENMVTPQSKVLQQNIILQNCSSYSQTHLVDVSMLLATQTVDSFQRLLNNVEHL